MPCCLPALGFLFWPLQLQGAALQLLSSTGLQQQTAFINCTGTTSALMLLFLAIPWCLGAADIAFPLSGCLISRSIRSPSAPFRALPADCGASHCLCNSLPLAISSAEPPSDFSQSQTCPCPAGSAIGFSLIPHPCSAGWG